MSRPISSLILLGLLLEAGSTTRPASAEDADASRLVAALARGDADARVHALCQIARLGHRAIPLVPALLPCLDDPHPSVRAATSKLLRQIGPEASVAADRLVERLSDPDPLVRREAAEALTRIPAAPAKLIKALAPAVRTDPRGLAEPALDILAGVGPPALSSARELLDEQRPELVILGARVLQRLGPASAPAIGRLMEIGRRPEPEVREEVARALACCGDMALGSLIRGLRDRDPKVREVATRSIQLLAFRASAAIPALIEALGDPGPPGVPRPQGADQDSRPGSEVPTWNGYHGALVAIGPPALRALVARLDRPNRRERILAMEAIAAFGDGGTAATPALIHQLVEPGCRAEAASTLGWLGASARAAVPRLVPATKNSDPLLRLRAVEALGRITPSFPTPAHEPRQALVMSLKDGDARIRLAAIRSLTLVDTGAPASEVRPLLFDPDGTVRVAAIEAVTRKPGNDEGLARDLATCRRDPDPQVRRAAISAWMDDPQPDVPTMIGLLSDTDPDVRAAVASRLARADEGESSSNAPSSYLQGDRLAGLIAGVPHVGDALRAALNDGDSRVRVGAIHALTALPGETESVSRLVRELGAADPSVRRAAASALGRFGHAAREALPTLFAHLDDVGDGSPAALSIPQVVSDSIEKIRPEEAPIVYSRLVDLFSDPRPGVREAANEALQSCEPAIIRWLCDALSDARTPECRRKSLARCLAGGGISLTVEDRSAPIEGLRKDVVVPALREVLMDLREDDELRTSSLTQLRKLEPDPGAKMRLTLEAFGRMRLRLRIPDDLDDGGREFSLPVLSEALRDPDPSVRSVAASLVDVYGERFPYVAERWELTRGVIARLDDAESQVRWAAASALRSLRLRPPHDRLAMERLRALLRDRETRLTPGCWYVTGAHPEVIGAIRIVTNCDAPKVRAKAAECLGLFSESDPAASAVPELIDALKDDDPLVRQSALLAMGAFEEKAAPAVDTLIEALNEHGDQFVLPSDDTDLNEAIDGGSIRKSSAWALGQIGEPAKRAVCPLIRALDDPNPSVRDAAAEALGNIGALDPSAIAALDRALHDPFDRRRIQAAAKALGQSGRPGVLPLLAALRSDDPDTCILAANSIPLLAEESNTILPALRQAAQSEDFALRKAAGQAIGRLKEAARAEKAKRADNDEDGTLEEPR